MTKPQGSHWGRRMSRSALVYGSLFQRRAMSKIALLLLLFSSELAAQTLSPQVQEFVKVSSGVIVLSHVRVIDGTGASALENQAVIVRQDRIEWIGDASTATMPKEARVLDLSGES